MSFNRSIWRSFSRILGAPFRLLYSAAKRLTRNWKYGKVRNLILGLPAVGALAVCLWMSALVRANSETLRRDYIDAADDRIAAGEYADAEIYLRRLLNESNDPQVEFKLGELFERTNRPDRADFIYRKLAPDTPSGGSGYGPAHRQRALMISQALANGSSTDHIGVLYRHLMLADDPDAPDLAQAWAVYHLAQGEPDKAIERLTEVIEGSPDTPGIPVLNVLLGNVYGGLGEREKAQEAYQRAVDHFREQLKSNESDRTLRIILFQTLLRMGDFEGCEFVLKQGHQLDPEGPYKVFLAGLCTTMHDVAAQRGGVPIPERLALLYEALDYEPNFGPTYERLLLYGQERFEGRKTLTEVLEGMIAAGNETGMAHFTLSLIKWNENDFERCRFHLERAIDIEPNLALALNNLAWIRSNQDPVDLDTALELIDRAMEFAPGDPKFLDTRATIYIKLQRWNDAYSDLELAITNNLEPQLEIQLHQSMVSVCEQLGQTTLAETHRKLIGAIEAEVAKAEQEAAADESSSEEAPAEGAPADENAADATPAEETPAETPPAIDPMAEDASPDPANGTETPDPGS